MRDVLLEEKKNPKTNSFTNRVKIPPRTCGLKLLWIVSVCVLAFEVNVIFAC